MFITGVTVLSPYSCCLLLGLTVLSPYFDVYIKGDSFFPWSSCLQLGLTVLFPYFDVYHREEQFCSPILMFITGRKQG